MTTKHQKLKNYSLQGMFWPTIWPKYWFARTYNITFTCIKLITQIKKLIKKQIINIKIFMQ